MKTFRELIAGVVLSAAIFAPSIIAQAGQAPPSTLALGQQLVAALKATPGVLGVEVAQTASGKQVIFAWFENKKAALTWYYSDTHMGLKNSFAPGGAARTPMADVPDDGKPIMAIASLTMGKQPPSASNPFPVSQIAIELYAPLPGGLAAGGRFAPMAMKVPGLVDAAIPVK
jgi:hypothetical protein